MNKHLFKSLALILVLSMLFSLTACGPKEKEPSVDDTKEVAEKAETEDKGGEKKPAEARAVVTNLQAAASTSDPFAHANVNDRQWLLNCYEPLFCYNGLTGEHEPRVAKNFEISEDGITYTIEIFDNIYFQNGKHVTAEDVKKSYEYGQASPYNQKFSGIVDKVEVLEDYKLNIILKEPSSPFLSNSDQIFIIDTEEVEKQGEDFGKKPNTAGTGAYYIEKYDPAVEIVLKRHEKFHRPIDGEPIPQVTFKVMTDRAAALIAFESGDLDFITAMPASNYEALAASDKFTTYLGQTTQLVYMNMNPMNPNAPEPLKDKRVRQALAYAANYEAMLAIGMEGQGNISGKIAYAPYTIAGPREEDGIKYTYDPDKAKELLKEAGYEDGFDLGKITVIAGSSHEKMGQVMQENLANIGVKSQLDSMEQVTTISEMFKGNFTFGFMGYYMMMDYDYFTGIVDIDGNKQSTVKMDGNPDFDYEKIFELYREARRHTDEDKRRAIYTELEDILMDGAVIIPVLHTALPYAWDKGLEINTNKPYTYHYSQFWDAYWK